MAKSCNFVCPRVLLERFKNGIEQYSPLFLFSDRCVDLLI